MATNWSSECCVAVRQLLAGKTVTVKLVETVENSCIHVVDIQLSMGRFLERLEYMMIKSLMLH